MTTDTTVPQLLGCDDSQAYLALRYGPVNHFLVTQLPAGLEWASTYVSTVRQQLQEQFQQLEQQITTQYGGRQRWEDEYLLPVARELQLIQPTWERIVRQCWLRGYFDQSGTNKRSVQRPPLDMLLLRLGELLQERQTSRQQRHLLLQEGLCRDQPCVSTVVKKLAAVNTQAANHARAILLSAIRNGLVGLLRYSDYPCAEELCLLQRYAAQIAQRSEQPDHIMGLLRSDLVCLYHILRTTLPELRLWKENLLHEPENSLLRQRYTQQLVPAVRESILTALAARRGCAFSDAAQLFAIFITTGLAGLVDWRCAATESAQTHSVFVQRMEQIVYAHLGALTQEAQQLILSLLSHIYDASLEVEVALPLLSLLREHPSSHHRVRVGRRLAFGMPAIIRRRQQRRQRRKMNRLQRIRQRKHGQEDSGPSPEDRLVAAFSRQSGLTEREARARLSQLITYGGIGMLPKGDWPRLIDQRLMAYISFFKLGKPEGALHWQDMYQRLLSYAALIGVVAPSLPLTKVLFNSVAKPSHWHGGLGEAVAQVRQRVTLIINAPRLHETWLVLPIRSRLRIPIIDSAGQRLQDTCRVALVIDRASQRPVGCWAGLDQLDIGLALYQSIWHPGATYWPLRGIPDHIQLPQSLLGQQREDIERAATWMLADIEVLNSGAMQQLLDTCPYIDELLRRVVLDVPAYLRQKYGVEAITLRHLQEALLTWMVSDEHHVGAGGCFPHHRSALIPADCSATGMVLPAADCPAAGWLLPVAAQCSSSRNSISYDGISYTAPDFSIEPGIAVPVRAFPYHYEGMPRSLFIEQEPGMLRYLRATE